MAVLVVTQILLGASIIWTARAVVPNSLHVATGASLFATSLILSLHSSRLARAASRGGAR
jgi:heme A synthase